MNLHADGSTQTIAHGRVLTVEWRPKFYINIGCIVQFVAQGWWIK